MPVQLPSVSHLSLPIHAAPPATDMGAGYERPIYRALAVVGLLLIPLMRFVHLAADPAAVDPWWARALMIAVCAVVLAASWLAPGVLLRRIVYGAFYAITGWLFLLLWANHFAYEYAVALLVVTAGISTSFAEKWHLAVYGALCFLALAFVTAVTADPEIHVALYVSYALLLGTLSLLGVGTRMRIQERLAASRERFALAAYGANDGLFDWDIAQDRVFFSTRWMEMVGSAATEVADDPEEWLSRLHEDDRNRVENAIAALDSSDAAHFECEYRIRHSDGEWRHMIARAAVVRDGAGRVTRLTGSQSDVTLRKRAEARLVHDALHDVLTELPNRTLFLDRLEHLLMRAQRRPSLRFAVLFVDLDRFKVVNDSLGHSVGDRLLIEVAGRLQQVLHAEDTLARLGGDEFGILLDDIGDADDAIRTAARIDDALAEPFQAQGQRLYVSASTGISLGSGGSARESLLRDADTAMYRAKQQRIRYALFDEAMHRDAVAQLRLESDLRHALERDEFIVHYQPIVELTDATVVGFEALVRWRHPDRGILLPNTFIPLVEEIGLAGSVGRRVLDESCARYGEWNQLLPPSRALGLSVNVSGKQFLEDTFADEVIDILLARRMPFGRLKLEITETAMMEDPAGAVRALQRLRAHGVSISIDDFGTGYSSLAYLQKLPVDSLKIAREFVSGLPGRGSEAGLVRAIVSIASTLGIETIAEGVETDPQRRALSDLGCRLGQGWLFAPALAGPDASTVVRQGLGSGAPV